MTWGKIVRRSWLAVPMAAALVALAGCATNPVTGETELSFLSESWEVKFGTENYLSTRQASGGAYTIDPDLTAYVNEVGRKLAAVSGRPGLPYEFVVINNSVPNAWALPGGKIAINRGLLVELDNEAELAAVLGHEVVHSAARHSAKKYERMVASEVVLTGLTVVVASSKYGDYAPLFQQIAGAGVGLTMLAYGRDQELEADLYGTRYLAKAGYDPRAATDLQKTFLRLSKAKKSSWLEGLLASHPPTDERVTKNTATAATLPKGGALNRERYQRRIAHIRKVRPAYDAIAKGKKMANAGQLAEALRLADKAVAIEPREAAGYALRGEVHARRKEWQRAIADYDEAIRRNDRYFEYYLVRGKLREQVGEKRGASADLASSVALLPTAAAHLSLGNLALAQGLERDAIGHFRKASEAPGDAGNEARLLLARLVLPAEPGRYIGVAAGRDRRYRLVLEVRNKAPVPVRNVRVHVRGATSTGGWIDRQIDVPGTLQPNRSYRFTTSFGPFRGDRPIKRLSLGVTRAQVAR